MLLLGHMLGCLLGSLLVKDLPDLLRGLSLLGLLVKADVSLHNVPEVVDLGAGAHRNNRVAASKLVVVHVDLNDLAGLSEEIEVGVVSSAHVLNESAIDRDVHSLKRQLLSSSVHLLLRATADDDLSLISVEGALLKLDGHSILLT